MSSIRGPFTSCADLTWLFGITLQFKHKIHAARTARWGTPYTQKIPQSIPSIDSNSLSPVTGLCVRLFTQKKRPCEVFIRTNGGGETGEVSAFVIICLWWSYDGSGVFPAAFSSELTGMATWHRSNANNAACTCSMWRRYSCRDAKFMCSLLPMCMRVCGSASRCVWTMMSLLAPAVPAWQTGTVDSASASIRG